MSVKIQIWEPHFHKVLFHSKLAVYLVFLCINSSHYGLVFYIKPGLAHSSRGCCFKFCFQVQFLNHNTEINQQVLHVLEARTQLDLGNYVWVSMMLITVTNLDD